MRLEAGRLRSCLREYSDTEGSQDPLRIDIPKGGYFPAFAFPTAGTGAAKPLPLTVTQPPSVQATSGNAPPSWPRWAVAGFVLLALAAASAGRWYPSNKPVPSDSTAGRQISLAVLPFANETGNKADDYLADGLTDNLMRQLSDIPPLKVMSRGAVYRFRSRRTRL